jgi:hypothetical protein
MRNDAYDFEYTPLLFLGLQPSLGKIYPSKVGRYLHHERLHTRLEMVPLAAIADMPLTPVTLKYKLVELALPAPSAGLRHT